MSTPDPVAFRRPPGRYGPVRGGRSRSATVATAVLALLFAGAIVSLAWRASNPDLTYQVRAYDVVSDQEVELTFLVRRADAESAVSCVVRARDTKSQEVGRSTVKVAAGRKDTLTTVTLTTTARANLAEVQTCTIN